MNKIKSKFKFLFFILIFIVYLFSGFNVVITNDSVTNVQQIMALDIFSRSSHFMFHFLGVGFYLLFGKISGLSAIVSTEIMLSFMSVLGAISLFYIAGILFKDLKIQYLSVLIYSFSSGIWRMSCQSEYLILVPSFALLSFLFYLKNKNFISGVFWGMGILTSPFAIFIAPVFLMDFEFKKQYFIKLLFLFTGVVFSYGLVNIVTYSETVSGEWSYGHVLSYYYKSLKPVRMISILLYGYIRSFNILIVPFVIGIFLIFKDNKKLFFVIVLLFISHIPVMAQEARLGAYQLPVYPFVALLTAYAVNKFSFKSWKIIYVFIVIFVFINLYLVLSERTFYRDLRDTYVQMNNDTAIKDSSLVFMYQAVKPVKEVYAPRLKLQGIIHEVHKEGVLNMNPGFKELNYDSVFKLPDKIYFIESGVLPPDDEIKSGFLSFADKQGVKTKGFLFKSLKRYLEKKKITRLKNYKLDVYCIE